jgi:integrase
MASITPRGDKFLAQVRIKQGGVLIFSESKLFDTRPQACSWGERLEAKVKAEGPAKHATSKTTVGQLVRLHLKAQLKVRPLLGRSTIHNHEKIAAEFDHILVRDLRPKHLIDYAVRRKTQDGVAPATIKSDLSPVSAAFGVARIAYEIDADPEIIQTAMRYLDEQGLVSKSKEVIRWVDQEEEDALLEEFVRRNQHHSTEIDMTLIYKFALAFPRRLGELGRLEWKDIDPKRRTIIIRKVKHPKKKEYNDQVVPLLTPAWDLLKIIPKLDARIFPFNMESVSAAFERVRDRIAETGLPRIKDLRFHDLRHTGISMLFWHGFQIAEVAIVSGHTNWNTLRRYTHIRPEDLHRRFEQLKKAEQPHAKANAEMAATSSLAVTSSSGEPHAGPQQAS